MEDANWASSDVRTHRNPCRDTILVLTSLCWINPHSRHSLFTLGTNTRTKHCQEITWLAFNNPYLFAKKLQLQLCMIATLYIFETYTTYILGVLYLWKVTCLIIVDERSFYGEHTPVQTTRQKEAVSRLNLCWFLKHGFLGQLSGNPAFNSGEIRILPLVIHSLLSQIPCYIFMALAVVSCRLPKTLRTHV